jgi:hypothetical protein
LIVSSKCARHEESGSRSQRSRGRGDARRRRARDGAQRFFYVPPGHVSWLVGDQPSVSLRIMGSEEYSR